MMAAIPTSSSPWPATSIPTSAITPTNPISSPRARIGVGLSEWSKRMASSAPMSGTAATMIAASDEETRCSPIASIGKGIATSTTANASSQRHRPRTLASVPARQASASSTTAPSVTRPQARAGAVTPWSTAILMNRYGTPQMTEASAKASHARRVITASSLAGSAGLSLAELVNQPQQVERAERLGHEQVRAGLLGVGLDAVAERRGQHHDRRVGRGVVGTEPPARLDPVQARHVDVEEHERRPLPPRHLERLDPVARLVQLVLRDVLERGGDQLADELVVIDDQHPMGHRISAAIRSKT